VVALYDYDPVELSPNEDPSMELKFVVGDVFVITSSIDEDGFYEAEHRITRLRGLIPSNFITIYEPAPLNGGSSAPV
jgi:hypothetical protein